MQKDDKAEKLKPAHAIGLSGHKHAGGSVPVGWLNSTMLSDDVGLRLYKVEETGQISPLDDTETEWFGLQNSCYAPIFRYPSSLFEMVPKQLGDTGGLSGRSRLLVRLRNHLALVDVGAKRLGDEPTARSVVDAMWNSAIHDTQAEAVEAAKSHVNYAEARKRALIDAAVQRTIVDEEQDPLRRDALALLGLDHSAIDTPELLIEAIASGFPSTVIKALRQAGWTYEVMEKVIVPRRTLMRRKSGGQVLTAAESDAAWRLAYILAASSTVFSSRDAALGWLTRPKAALKDRSPAELLQSSVGTQHILSVLRRIDVGDFA